MHVLAALVALSVLGSGCIRSDIEFGITDAGPLASGDRQAELLLSNRRLDTLSDQSEILRRDRTGLVEDRIGDANGIERDLRIHPDGDRFVYVLEATPGDPTRRELFLDSLSGSRPRDRLTTDGFEDNRPSFSGDGTQIVFDSSRGAGPRLYVVPTDGSRVPQRFLAQDFDQSEPDWSPTEQRVVFVRTGPTVLRPQLWTALADGSDLRQITDGGTFPDGDRDPAFSADGLRIVFSRAVSLDRRALFSVASDGTDLQQLTDPDGEDTRPRLSRDGSSLFFLGSRPAFGDQNRRLFVADASGSGSAVLGLAQRFEWTGLEVLPGSSPVAQGVAVTPARIRGAAIVNGLGRVAEGAFRDVEVEDGFAFGLESVPDDGLERVGLTIAVPLDLDELARIGASLEDLVGLELEVVASLEPSAPGDRIRLGLRNTVFSRTDIAIEREPTGAFESLRLSLASLEHVDRDGVVRVILVGEKPADQIGVLRIDSVDLMSVTASTGTATLQSRR